jgi:DNA-binding MarR family transcriptional regulator
MIEDKIARIRSFNRYYTSVIGLLDKQYLNSEFSLTEARILYELYHCMDGMTAKDIIELLNLDKGYLSRILQSFEKRKLIEKRQSENDKRSFYLYLSPNGSAVFSKLNIASQQQVADLLTAFTEREINELTDHMEAIRNILEKSTAKKDDE